MVVFCQFYFHPIQFHLIRWNFSLQTNGVHRIRPVFMLSCWAARLKHHGKLWIVWSKAAASTNSATRNLIHKSAAFHGDRCSKTISHFLVTTGTKGGVKRTGIFWMNHPKSWSKSVSSIVAFIIWRALRCKRRPTLSVSMMQLQLQRPHHDDDANDNDFFLSLLSLGHH